MGVAKSASKNMRKKDEAVSSGLNKMDERYMNGHPTRIEVANYVNALLDEHYVPRINATIQMSSMILQALLIEKGICTGEEIQKMTEEFMKEHEKRQKTMDGFQNAETLKDLLTQDYALALAGHVDTLQSGKIDFQDSHMQESILYVVNKAYSTFMKVLGNPASITDDIREGMLQELAMAKRDVEIGKVKCNSPEGQSTVMGILWDAILPFAHKGLTKAAMAMKDGEDYDESDDVVDPIGINNHSS